MNRQTRAQGLGLAAVLLWSTVPTAFKLSLRHLRPPQLLMWATIFSILVLGVVLTLQGRLGQTLRMSQRQYLWSAALGFLNPFLYYAVLFVAYDRLPAQIAQPLNYTWALTLAWLSVPLLHHHLRRRDLLAGVVCYLGVVIISTGGRPGGGTYDTLGIALALGSTLIWSLYWIWSTRNELEPAVGLFVAFVFALPMVVAYAALNSGLSTGGRAGLLGGLYVGIFEMGLTFLLWLTAMKLSTNASRVANLIFISPFVSLGFIALVLGETIRPSTPLGLILIVAALVMQNREEGGQRKKKGAEVYEAEEVEDRAG